LRTANVAVFALAFFAAACTSNGTTGAEPSSGAAPPASAAEPVGAGLDPSFGSGGEVTTSFTSGHDSIAAIAVQADGKLVAVGSADSDAEFALARYNPNGSLDSTFGDGGKVTTDFTKDGDWADAVAVQPDGKIVAAGGAGQTGSGRTLTLDFAIARYSPDGTLDPTFGDGGKVMTGFTPGGDYVTGIAIQADGKIVAAGMEDDRIGDDSNFALARYNPDGSLDTTFGQGGMVTTDFAQKDGANAGIVLQADGKIVAAGVAIPDGFALARYNPDGSLDTTFGKGGLVTTSLRDAGAVFHMALLPDGGILAAGGGFSTDPQRLVIARFTSSGKLDSGFGTDGILTSKLSGPFGSIAVQDDGKIVAEGPSFTLVRFDPDGSLDPGFGANGELTTDLGSGFTSTGLGMGALAIDGGGDILAGGYASSSKSDWDFALVRYLAT
jgi:uncharacterized delta-60 repeat protein